MGIYYNSYELDLKHQLQHYVEWKVFVENQKEVLNNLRMEISLEPVLKTTKFGFDAGGGGWDKPSQEEMYVSQKDEKEHRYQVKLMQVKQLESQIRILDNCLEALTGTEAQIVKDRFIYGKKWEAVAIGAGCNEKTCRDKAHRAISKMSRMVYAEAGPSQTNLKFFPMGLSVS
jgi:hypothetical protein